jgi:hypothetical protein
MFEFDEKHFCCEVCQKTSVNSIDLLQSMWLQMIDFFGLSGDFREISLDFASLEDIKQIYKEEGFQCVFFMFIVQFLRGKWMITCWG